LKPRFILILLALTALFSQPVHADPIDDIFARDWTGTMMQLNLREPSGIVYHLARETLFVVGDEGHVGEFSTDGAQINKVQLREGDTADFEGITTDPNSGLLYIAVESEAAILEIDPESLSLLRTFTIDGASSEVALLASNTRGIEAITFVTDAEHPQGGTFFLASQGTYRNVDDLLSLVVELQLPIRDETEDFVSVGISRYFTLEVYDLSGMYYDAASDHLYLISDDEDTFLEVTREGEILRQFVLPGEEQEGVTMDADGYLYIAQDSGGVVKIR